MTPKQEAFLHLHNLSNALIVVQRMIQDTQVHPEAVGDLRERINAEPTFSPVIKAALQQIIDDTKGVIL